MGNIASWSSVIPSGTSQLRDFDDLYRSDKSVLESGIDTEHYFDNGSAASVGVHRLGSARVHVGAQSAVSTTGDSGRLMWTTDWEQMYVLSSVSSVALPSLRTANTWVGRQSFSTGITLTGSQIAFPASAIPSTDPNTLDEYKEGSWTPGIAFGGAATGITYSEQIGTYVKVGKFVFCRGSIHLSDNGSATGTMTITGLPFTALSASGAGSVTFSYQANISGAGALMGLIAGGTTAIIRFATATGATLMTDTNTTNSTELEFTIVYQAAS